MQNLLFMRKCIKNVWISASEIGVSVTDSVKDIA